MVPEVNFWVISNRLKGCGVLARTTVVGLFGLAVSAGVAPSASSVAADVREGEAGDMQMSHREPRHVDESAHDSGLTPEEAERLFWEREPTRKLLDQIQDRYPDEVAYRYGGDNPSLYFRGEVPSDVRELVKGHSPAIELREGIGHNAADLEKLVPEVVRAVKEQVPDGVGVSAIPDGEGGIDLSVHEQTPQGLVVSSVNRQVVRQVAEEAAAAVNGVRVVIEFTEREGGELESR